MRKVIQTVLSALLCTVMISGAAFAAGADTTFVNDSAIDSSILSENTNIDPTTVNLLPAVPDTLEGVVQAIKSTPGDMSLYPKAASFYGKTSVSGFKVFAKGALVDFSKYDNVNPTIIQGRTLIPVRAMAESLGAQVAFNEATQEITITLNDRTVSLKLNSDQAVVNGVAKTLEVPAATIGGRTMVPLRFVGEAFGKQVGWYPSGDVKVISITE